MNIATTQIKLYVDWYSYSYNFNGRLNTSTYGQIIKLNVGSSTGQVAYCIQSSKDAWTTIIPLKIITMIYQEHSDLISSTLTVMVIKVQQNMVTTLILNVSQRRLSSGISVTVGSTTLPKARLSVYSPRVCQALWLQMSRLAITRSKSRC